jgi:hypothetical protein
VAGERERCSTNSTAMRRFVLQMWNVGMRIAHALASPPSSAIPYRDAIQSWLRLANAPLDIEPGDDLEAGGSLRRAVVTRPNPICVHASQQGGLRRTAGGQLPEGGYGFSKEARVARKRFFWSVSFSWICLTMATASCRPPSMSLG